MKKSLILLVIVFLVIAGMVLVTVPSVFGDVNKLEYQEETVYGDPKYLDGLQLDFEVVDNLSFQWDNKVSFENGKPVTASKFRNLGFSGYRMKYHSPVRMLNVSSNFDNLEIYEKYIGEFTPGKWEVRKIYLKELAEYYPIIVDVFFPGVTIYYNDKYQSDTDYAEYNNEVLSRYFRIPVIDDEQIGLSYDGNELSVEYWLDSCDGYSFHVDSCYSEDSFYFSFSNRTRYGNLVDTSLLQQGYGIYRLPVIEVNRDDYKGCYRYEGLDIDVDNISCLYKVDESVRIVSVEYLEDKKQLLMVSYLDNTYYMDVIDPETGKQLDRRKLNEVEEYTYPEYMLIEGREFLHYANGLFQILGTDEQGKITCEFEYMLNTKEKNDTSFPLNRLSDYGNFMHNSLFRFHDGRLTAISTDYHTGTLNIAVFEGNSEKYYGRLRSSLDLVESYSCQSYINEVTGV